MQNIDVRFNASSNFTKVRADLAALEAQAANLGRVFEKNAFAKTGQIVDPQSWRNATNAVELASKAYRDAASSSGIMTTQQIRANSEVKRYTELLQKQKLSFKDIRKNADIMRGVYRDQLRMQRMVAQYWGTDQAGRAVTDIAIPKGVPKELDNWRTKMSMFGHMTASASTQMVNLGKNTQWAGRQLTVGLSYPIALVGAAAGVMAYQTDAAMQKIAKVYDVSVQAQQSEAARTKELTKLRADSWNLASQAANDYGSSLKSTLAVEQELAATGERGQQLFKTTKEVQRVSTLGDIDPQQTTQMVVALQTAFRSTIKDSNDLTNTLNFMNAASNATSLSLQDIAEATPRAASGFAQLGGTAQEMTVALVSMREAGVDAAEGANALKSASTRIINPVKKAKDFYDSWGISLENLAKQSGGNLFKYLQLLGKEQQKIQGPTEKQTALLRAQGVAALFGTYQNNRLTASLVNLTDAYGGVDNQTRKALDLMNQTPEQLAKTAGDSMKTIMDSASGRFKRAWNQFQIQLSEFGQPILEKASAVLEIISKITGEINKLGEGKKNFIVISSLFLAAVGPGIMLTGLMMNLVGQFGKGVGAIAKLVGGMKIFTTEQRAALLTTEAENNALMKNTEAVSTLAQEIAVLTASYQKAIQSTDVWAQANTAAAGMAERGTQAVIKSEEKKAAAYANTTEAINAEIRAMTAAAEAAAREGKYAAITPRSIPYSTLDRNVTLATGFRGESIPQRESDKSYAARQAAANREVDAMNKANMAQAAINNKANAEAAIRNKTAQKITGAKLEMGLMSASMATMLISGNKTADAISKWALGAAVAIPLIKGAAGWMTNLATATKEAAAAQAAANVTTGLTSSSALKAAGGMAAMRAGAMGFGTAISAALGPIGWIALTVAAIGGGLLLWKHHQDDIAKKQEEIYQKQVASNKMLVSGANDFTTALGRAVNVYDNFLNMGPAGSTAPGENGLISKTFAYYTGQGKKQLSPFKGMDNEEQLVQRLMLRFVDLQKISGMTAKEAMQSLQGLLLALGKSGDDALRIAQQIAGTIGDINKTDWSSILSNASGVARQDFMASAKKAGYNPSTAGFLGVAQVDWNAEREKYRKGLSGISSEITHAAQMFNTAWNNAANPDQAKKIMDTYLNAALAEFNAQFQKMMQNPVLAKMLSGKGITSGAGLARAFDTGQLKESDFYNLAKGQMPGDKNFVDTPALMAALKTAQDYEEAWGGALTRVNDMDNSLTQVYQIQDKLVQSGKTMNYKEAVSSAKDWMGNLDAARQILNDARKKSGGIITPDVIDATKNLGDTAETTKNNINKLNASLGYKQGVDAADALYNLMHRVSAETGDAANNANTLKNNLNQIPTAIHVKITADEAIGMVKDSMAGVQSDMAASAQRALGNRWDASMQALSYRQQDASDALSRHQEDAMDAFDRKWEKRKNAVSKYYDARINAVKKAIDAEQKADDIRQKIFEAEKERMARMAELENSRIDFNAALNAGNLDEAAKINNDITAKQIGYAMDDAESAADAASKKRQARLQNEQARIEKQRDRELKQLDNLEDRMRKHLQRVQQARSRALARQQEEEQRAMQKQRDYEEAMLDQRLALFQAYTGKNQKDLERWMKHVGLTYDDFGTDVKAKGEAWSTYFQTSLRNHIQEAGAQIASDKMWKQIGKSAVDQLLSGLGFSSLQQFTYFAKTGQMKNFSTKATNEDHEGHAHIPASNHGGGLIGSARNNRTGFSGSQSPHNERTINAQVGEFMVNKKAVGHYGKGFFNALNDRRIDKNAKGGRFTGGPAALLAGAVGAMFMKGVAKGMMNAVQKGQERANYNSLLGAMFSGKTGKYGGQTFSAEQMSNAAIIASVGSKMGMTGRDIEIGIMTAITESGLRNINYGDRDSLGLFQQRPSQGWGTAAQVTNPEYAARKFFSALSGVKGRGGMAPWLAAQAVQRSAYSDGSNYRQYWDEALAIFTKGLTKKGGAYAAANGTFQGILGGGGRHKPINFPVTNGLHDSPPGVDMAAPIGTPVYAVSDGKITRSYDIRGYEPRRMLYGRTGAGVQDGFRSYGRVIYFKPDGYNGELIYAHLSQRMAAGRHVPGGTQIGAVGNAGNVQSTSGNGAHLHFANTGGSPYTFLRNGGELRWDNTMVMGHRKETMLSAPLTSRFKEGVKEFGKGGGGDTYEMTLDFSGAIISSDVDIEKAMDNWWRKKNLKVGVKKVVR